MTKELGIAKQHCANHTPAGCLGIGINPQPRKGELCLNRFRPELSTCLLEGKERCTYFETCVLPGQMGKGLCVDCGKPRPARHQRCELCAIAQRRKQVASSVKNHRQRKEDEIRECL